MFFSTAGFQRGALQYAAERGIATVAFINGNLTYFTKSAGPPTEPSVWANVPRFAGQFMTVDDKTISISVLDARRADPLDSWLEQ